MQPGALGSAFAFSPLRNQAVQAYYDDPFDADAIAMLRPQAFQMATVMNYVQNLIRQGDALYTEKTRESIQEAYIFYEEAYDLLGRPPQSEARFSDLQDNAQVTLNSINTKYSGAGQPIQEFLVGLEGSLDHIQLIPTQGKTDYIPYNMISGLYFGIPQNDQLLNLYSTLDSRFYNLRNNLDIDGNPMDLALFQPSLNPLALESGAANGTLAETLNHLYGTTAPNYRFYTQLGRAKEFAGQTAQFGQQLLSVMQQKDAEALAQLQTAQQGTILEMTLQVKQDQVDAAQNNVSGLLISIQSALLTKLYYQGLLQYDGSGGRSAGDSSLTVTDATTGISVEFNFQDSVEGSNLEAKASTSDCAARVSQDIATTIQYSSMIAYCLPNIFGLAEGGEAAGKAIDAAANGFGSTAQAFSFIAEAQKTQAGYSRRRDEWTLQMDQADHQLNQSLEQWQAATTQFEMAQRDYRIAQVQIQQNAAISNYYRRKFTNEALYQWMKGQLLQLYYQSYKLSVQVSQEAQTAFEYEKGLEMGSLAIVNTASWNSRYDGLMSAEPLIHSLNNLEKHYMDVDSRGMEITKTVSLATLLSSQYGGENQPATFSEYVSQQMQSTNTPYGLAFTITEKSLDGDYPGHYCRQIANIAVSIPTLLGPYQDIHATLTQTANAVVVQDDDNAEATIALMDATPSATEPIQSYQAPAGTTRNIPSPNQTIAMSRGLDDTGMFVLNMGDSRYLPFEGTGAVSSWNLYISDLDDHIQSGRQYSLTINDIILTIRYTALVGDNAFRKSIITAYKKSNSQGTIIT